MNRELVSGLFWGWLVGCAFAAGSQGIPVYREYSQPIAIYDESGHLASGGEVAVEMQLQEVAAGLLAPPLQCPVEDGVVVEYGRQLMRASQPGDVGDGLDVEDEDRRHRRRRSARQPGNTPVDR